MSKWIAEFELEDGDTMPEHMDLQYKGANIDFHCRPMWIPVSERLPERDGDYLVCFEKGYKEDYGFGDVGIAPFEVDCEGFGIWQENFDRYTLGSLGSEWVDIPVIAWMPLPEIYEG